MDHFHPRRPAQHFPIPADSVATPPDEATTPTPAHPDMSQDAAILDATPVAERRDEAPDVATESRHVTRQTGDMARHVDQERYTLTVEDVAVRLADENVYRDPRTIQRWCKSGKLDCILIALNSDSLERYLIDPASLDVMVAALIRDRDRQAHVASRQRPDTARQSETRRDDDATPDATENDTSRRDTPDSRDTVGAEAPAPEDDPTLQARVHQLETELAMAKGDIQVREQMVDYLKEQFEKVLDGALDRSEKIGELRAENDQLRNLLGDGAAPRMDNVVNMRSAERPK